MLLRPSGHAVNATRDCEIILSARKQTISFEETVNYLWGALSTEDFKTLQIGIAGSSPRWVASLQPHHPPRASAASKIPTLTHLMPTRRRSTIRLFFTFSANVAHSASAGSLTPLSRQHSSKRLI